MPSEFAKELETKEFYNREHDMPLVAGLYKQVFREELNKVRKLEFHKMGWKCDEVSALARVVASGAVPNLHELNVSFNEFGDPGAKKLAAALIKALPPLDVFEFKGNPFGDQGRQALQKVKPACKEAQKKRALDPEAARENEAAAKIQAIKRGQQARREVEEKKGKQQAAAAPEKAK